MFKTKTLTTTLSKVNSFIEELKDGIEKHVLEIAKKQLTIENMKKEQKDLQEEIAKASGYLKTLGA